MIDQQVKDLVYKNGVVLNVELINNAQNQMKH